MKKKPINTQPLVSIITPLYNAEAFIAQNVESVLGQTYQNWEQIIVDDASTDSSPDMVEAMQQRTVVFGFFETPIMKERHSPEIEPQNWRKANT